MIEAVSAVTVSSGSQWALSLSHNDLGSAFLDEISVDSVLLHLGLPTPLCYLCRSGGGQGYFRGLNYEDVFEKLAQTGAFCQEVAVRRAQIASFIRCHNRTDHLEVLATTSARVNSLLAQINATAACIMSQFAGSESLQWDVTLFSSIHSKGSSRLPRDFLGRTLLHQILDEAPDSILTFQPWAFFAEAIGGRSFQVQDLFGRTILHIACQKGLYRFVEVALGEGADPSATTICKSLPIHYAAAGGCTEICQELLKHMERSGIDEEDSFGYEPWDYARRDGYTKVAELLAKAAEEQPSSDTEGQLSSDTEDTA